MHLTEDELQTWIDGELDRGGEERLRAHGEACPACRDRRAELERELGRAADLLETLDRPVPAVTADDVMRRAGSEAHPSRADRQSHSRVLWAAGLAGVVVAGAVAAAVLPGGPLRPLIEAVTGRPGSPPPPFDATAPEAWGTQAGVALVPDREVEIRFAASQAGGAITLVAVEGDTTRVEVREEGVGFAVGGSSIQVENRAAAASYRISLPAGLPAARITVGGETIYERLDGRVVRDAFGREGEVGRFSFGGVE